MGPIKVDGRPENLALPGTQNAVFDPHGPARNGGPEFWIDLQWFAAEDEGRTEEPTEQKIRKAREEGKVAKSAELTSAIVLLFPIIALGILGSYILATFLEMMRFFLSLSTEIDIQRDARIIPAFFRFFMRITVPIFVVAFISALLGNILQVGFLFSAKPITPDLSRVLPRFGRFFKRALFSGEAAFNLGKSIFKIIVIGSIAFLNVSGKLDDIATLVSSTFWQSLQTISGVAFRILVEAAIALLLLSIPDYIFQRFQHRQSLRMSRQELKEERRMSEGDPLVRSRLRDRMRELLTRNMMRSVPTADVVVTNPTHYAIAMEWNRRTMDAPMVTAKGMDNIALRIREIAEEHDVPCIENKPLARALYSEVEIGDIIPEKYYEVMALVLAQVYKMNGQTLEAV
ncbi:MAG: flagellar biosynthesis protein FlhB [Spirochaetales bacterium]|nr:flagellar biosynthesis protein FlhB [Spirochaetales bacterium]